MALTATEIDIEARKQEGRDRAVADKAAEPKPLGQTSETNYPYTYWFLVGYNEQVGA